MLLKISESAVTSQILQCHFLKCTVDTRLNEIVTESTSEGLKGKFMLQMFTEELFWLWEEWSEILDFPQKVISVLIAMLKHSSQLGQSSAF
jgi:hypothetical protein